MSIEKLIQDHTSALRELTEVLRDLKSGFGAREPLQGDSDSGKPKAEAKKTTAKKAESKPEKDSPKAEEPAEQDSAATPEPKDGGAAAEGDAEAYPEASKQDVIDTTLALGKAGKRNDLVALLAEFGVQKSTQIDPERYGEFVVKAKALL